MQILYPIYIYLLFAANSFEYINAFARLCNIVKMYYDLTIAHYSNNLKSYQLIMVTIDSSWFKSFVAVNVYERMLCVFLSIDEHPHFPKTKFHISLCSDKHCLNRLRQRPHWCSVKATSLIDRGCDSLILVLYSLSVIQPYFIQYKQDHCRDSINGKVLEQYSSQKHMMIGCRDNRNGKLLELYLLKNIIGWLVAGTNKWYFFFKKRAFI